MLVYGDLARRIAAAAALDDIAVALQRLSASPPGVQRHGELVAAFVAAGELAQGIADADFAARGVDDRSPAQDAAMALLMAMADAVRSSWQSGFDGGTSLSADILANLSQAIPATDLLLKRPEGYAFYALYPESYLEAAARIGRDRNIRVIGIRSIGTGLAALVASALGAAAPVTVRPTGDPFRREIKVAETLAAGLLDDPAADFAVVDEGPGLSGSSFSAVADWLEARGVAPARIHFFPSHANDPGPQSSPPHRARWRNASRHVVEFDELVLGARSPRHRLEGWVTDLVGQPDGPLADLSGGAWRSWRFADEAEWPPCHVQQERRKFLLPAGGTAFLLKFVGLDRDGADKLELARRLHAAGFVPEPVGYRHGFLVERWMGDTQPVANAALDRASLVEGLGSYIGFRARALPARADHGASLSELFHMARHNAARGLDEEIAASIERWRGKLANLEGDVRQVRTDNRMHAWEWLRTSDGRLIKTDALDHHAAHDLVGCQDAAWDIAGATIEFDLSPDESSGLCEAFARVARRRVSRDLLAFYEVCYAAFQLGHWLLAAEALIGLPNEARRTRAAAGAYAVSLERLLGR